MLTHEQVTLNQVVAAILAICPTTDSFTPTNLRIRLALATPTIEPALLAARMQPHLQVLREHRHIAIIPTGQRRNRPHKILDRVRLMRLADNRGVILPRPGGNCDVVEPDEAETPIDVALERIEALEVRIDTLERELSELQGKVKDAASFLL